MPLYDTQSQCYFLLVKVNILYYHYCACCVFGEIKLLKENIDARSQRHSHPNVMVIVKDSRIQKSFIQ